ncbi:hypothetical protein N7522_002789 [Penicillium canescens]|uniref:Uncharacterized protein n=1 Tax=Penicillium canescens TaxID=5083 RepID=A0AAD6NDC0_PENCN|nr:uncharacterized protein N7446_007151 [Penicillium canescens]KAJ6012434.1 hypothetical protein N7522_002789 [Penicillium canescens]KAJ6049520.1 hypothetical protein N7444_006236 [Penicillium canescens]KAJ6052511.1 hypothetical protein N7460_003045 [Penicillium canescens]KAJ6063031.1 hypothetical protein N7446_007151 [Penicillium canescens]
MTARLSRSLPQVNRRVFAGLPFRAVPRVANASARAGLVAHRITWKLAPWTQANIARYSHTDSGSSAKPNASIFDVTPYRGSSYHGETLDEPGPTSWYGPTCLCVAVTSLTKSVATLIEPQAILHFI